MPEEISPTIETPQPTEPKSFDWPKVILVVVLGLGLLAGAAYAGYWYGTESAKLKTQSEKLQLKSQIPETPTPTSTLSPTPAVEDKLKGWKTYTNNKYKYEIRYPKDYLAGYSDTISGKFDESNGNEDQIDILPSLNDAFDSFLQIQVVDLKIYGKPLSTIVNDIYKKQKDHFQTTDISNLIKSEFNGFLDYEYTFSGQALYTLSWESTVTSGDYKVVLFEMNGQIYSFYLKNNDAFNQILSTFGFLD